MIVSKTPLRISFVGGGSDFKLFYQNNYGAVVSAAIDKYVYVFVNKRPDGLFRVGYSKTEFVNNIDGVEHDIIRESLKLLKIKGGIDITYIGDVSIGHAGTGLGSSSALTVGALNALYAHKGKIVSPKKLAEDACRIEIDILKRPIGKQDQYASAYGGINYIKFNSNESVDVKPIELSRDLETKLNNNLLMFNTGIDPQSSIVLNEQKRNIKDNYEVLSGVVKLSEILKNYLSNSDINYFGKLLHENWTFKKQFATKITNNIIDSYYTKAINAGASGGKILGSGGGGFMLFYCNSNMVNKRVREALKELRELNFQFSPEGSRIVYSD